MSNSIKVFSPSTVANVGCGYDVLGFALDGIGEEMVVTELSDDKMVILENDKFDLPLKPDKNVASVAAQALLDAAGIKKGYSFAFDKQIHPGSGMGTSASSSAGAVFAVNELIGRPFNTHQLVEFAMEGERMLSGKAHADNVAPNLLGGFTLVRAYGPLDVLQLPTPDNMYVAIVHPQVVVKTTDAKRMLKQTVKLDQAVAQWGNVGGLVSGLYESDFGLIGRSMEDHIVEPVRKLLIPLYDEVKAKALEEGAIGCSIAGSGPSIFAFAEGKATAEKIKASMQAIYDEVGILAYTYLSKIGTEGVRVL
ncbi:homoserine kinase [Gilvimarinus agarilyticus]|uniref:Homoserine kinase n=1 Tax=Reichenbachiella agariperforans TaxID=156994 RepID=A0A1M6R3P4_REIAG|nr:MULTISPECIES: homoserine kinase [Reichenbachiella]MBU2884172.1 homoserine kinase [Gilvimarinus agarilyticus]MBU2912804.1 homoserine kinase [Reichenbachiella agariperforans]PIB34140.1 homoserine kinase [Reichenbachiella sp. 5M10]RJE70682.1 homoserine kinase [Reichenbachiella sp. MSK19-1]SHK27053.1 homoserine kinase [Reichenbachiella agariperforans]